MLLTAGAASTATASGGGSGPSASPAADVRPAVRNLQPPSSAEQPTDVVIAIDESGTLQAQLNLEKRAAALIIASELNPGTRVAVVGFASEGGKGATDVCKLTVVGDQRSRNELVNCLDLEIRPRSAADGNNTDYVAALKEAIGVLTDPEVYTGKQRRRIVYFLSDGWLDPAGQQETGKPAGGADANAVERARFDLNNTYLPLAKRHDIEIWPVAFGDGQHDTPIISAYDTRDQDIGYPLDQLADQGRPQQAGCLATSPLSSTVPWLLGADDLTTKLVPVLALARCSYPGAAVRGTVGQDAARVTIPAGVAAASITVLDAPAGARIVFRPPDPAGSSDRGGPDGGRADGAGGSGEGGSHTEGGKGALTVPVGVGGPVVSVRIAQPAAGTWSVTVQPAPGARDEGRPLTAVAVWSVSAWFSALPAVVAPGTDVAVGVQLWAAPEVLRDAKLMAGVKVQLAIEDLGLPSADAAKASAPVDLHDDGRVADGVPTGGRAGDGLFQGFVRVPKEAKGTLVLVARVSGSTLGVPLCGDGHVACLEIRQPLTVGTSAAATKVQPQPFELIGRVPQGGETAGDIVVSGASSAQRPGLAFGLAYADTGVTIASSRQVSTGADATTTRYSLRVDRSVRVGEHVRGQVIVYDLSGTPYVWTRVAFDLTVIRADDRPAMGGWVSDHWWAFVLLVAALVILAAWRLRPRPEPVGGLTVFLYAGDDLEPVAHYAAADEQAAELAFKVFGENGLRRLDEADRRTADYRIRRKSRDVVQFWRKTYARRRWHRVDWDVDGWPRLPVSGGIRLELHDNIRAAGRGPVGTAGGGGT